MNYVAIIAGAFSVMLLGWIWFNPKVLGTPWMKEVGLTEDDMKNANPMTMVGALLMAVVIAWAFSRYASHTEEGMSQLVHGMYHGVMTALLFVAPVIVSKSLFEKKSLSWILIVAGYWVLAITILSGIVFALTPVAEAAG